MLLPSAKTVAASVAQAAAPTTGPGIVTLFGLDIPVLALSISLTGLILARIVSPPPSRKMTFAENTALTGLLCIIAFLAVTGQITGEPAGVGMGFIWGLGLGFSGLIIVENIGNRIREMVDVWIGRRNNKDGV